MRLFTNKHHMSLLTNKHHLNNNHDARLKMTNTRKLPRTKSMILNRKGRRHSIDLTNIANNIDKLYRSVQQQQQQETTTNSQQPVTLTLSTTRPSLSTYLSSSTNKLTYNKAFQLLSGATTKRSNILPSTTASTLPPSTTTATTTEQPLLSLKFDLISSEIRRMSLSATATTNVEKIVPDRDEKIAEATNSQLVTIPLKHSPALSQILHPVCASSPKLQHIPLVSSDIETPKSSKTKASNEISIMSISSSIISNDLLENCDYDEIIWTNSESSLFPNSSSIASSTTTTICSSIPLSNLPFDAEHEEELDFDLNRTLNESSCFILELGAGQDLEQNVDSIANDDEAHGYDDAIHDNSDDYDDG